MDNSEADQLRDKFNITPEDFEKITNALSGIDLGQEPEELQPFSVIISLTEDRNLDVSIDADFKGRHVDDIARILNFISSGDVTEMLVQAIIQHSKLHPKKTFLYKHLLEKWQELQGAPYVPSFQPTEGEN